jgi:predicted metal-dependent HD superfamily phosphohydrolase
MRGAGDALWVRHNPLMDPRVNFERWSAVCIAAGIAPNESGYRRVRRAWRGMGRHYHTLSHLDSCLREFDDAREFALRPAEVELALWFHDAVYRSWRRDNEAQSAALMAEVFRAAPLETVERIRRLIAATKHDATGFSGDTALIIDIDLSILGAPPEVYARFESAIRREYWWAPRALCRRPVEGAGAFPGSRRDLQSRSLLSPIREDRAREPRGRARTSRDVRLSAARRRKSKSSSEAIALTMPCLAIVRCPAFQMNAARPRAPTGADARAMQRKKIPFGFSGIALPLTTGVCSRLRPGDL